MTLLDAPQFDTVRDRRQRRIIYGSVIAVGVLTIGFWFWSFTPLDWPWTWYNHRVGTIAIDRFLRLVEKNDLPDAYGVWNHDKDWQQHPDKFGTYTFDRFKQDWSPTSSDNEYGAIQSHIIKVGHMYGNVLVVGSLINGRKSKPLFLDYDTKTRTLGFSPVEYYLEP